MHIPVLKDELIDGLAIRPGDLIVDGTLGGGGHTKEIIRRLGSAVKIICLDLDKDAIERTKKAIGEMDHDVVFRTVGFQDMDKVLEELNIMSVDRILLDLGLSSFQLDISGRGFSFSKDEPLLMTMKKNPTDNDLTAKEIINNWSEETLSDIIFGFGEEKYARRIAKAIVEERGRGPINTTFKLVRIIEDSIGKFYKGKKIHPATKTFQALRIAVNGELTNLEKVIEKGFHLLTTSGRIAIISFHSLEDRIVKKKFIELRKTGIAKLLQKNQLFQQMSKLNKTQNQEVQN